MFIDSNLGMIGGRNISPSQESTGVLDSVRSQGFDPGLHRPFIDPSVNNYTKFVSMDTGETRWDDKSNRYVPVRKKVAINELRGSIYENSVHNANFSLRKDDWIHLDQTVIRAARQRLVAWTDLASRNTIGGFDGYSKIIFEHEKISDPGQAHVDMDGLTDGTNDYPMYELSGIPLPITHCDFFFSDRKLAVSRTGGGPALDSAMVEAAARRVAEQVEQTVIGSIDGINYGKLTDYDDNNESGKVRGYTNFAQRNTKTDLTASASTDGATILTEVLAMRELAYADRFYGPFMLYVSTAYDALLDDDLKANSDKTVRQRLNEIENIEGVKRLDYLTGDVMVLVQMTSDVAAAINGMDITTMQWESKGGLQHNFKVMAIWVPLIRDDFNNRCGVVHGTTS